MTPEEALQVAQEMGITLPSPAWIFGCILFSLVGIAVWRYGKVRRNRRVYWLGIALMLYGYVAWTVWLVYGVGVALCVAAWWCARTPD